MPYCLLEATVSDPRIFLPVDHNNNKEHPTFLVENRQVSAGNDFLFLVDYQCHYHYRFY
jgi:hypothetical protein